MSNPICDHLLKSLGFPIIDESFYGSRIRSYKVELEALGVIVNLDTSSEIVIDKLKMLSSSTPAGSNLDRSWRGRWFLAENRI